jgi:uncharacterized protein (TIGR02145 family)
MMKKIILTGFAVVLNCSLLLSQVAINNDGQLPDNSAMMDLKSTTRGMLVPRMTIDQRNAISEPAKGLMVYCTDNNQYYTNKGTPVAPDWMLMSTQWSLVGSNLHYPDGNVGIGTTSPLQKLVVNGKISAQYGSTTSAAYRFGNGSENTGFSSPYPGSIAVITDGLQRMLVDGSGHVGITPTAPFSCAQLEVSSQTRGFLPPRMNTAQRDAIAAPAEGLMIYNTDEKEINVFTGSSWGPVTPVTCGQPFTDTRDGKIYNTVQIGAQCWMKENMNIGTKINGSADQTNNGTIEKYCYADLESNCDIYGGLYQWTEMMNYTTAVNTNPSGRQGICPTGWHVPSMSEFEQLTSLFDPFAGGALKEAGYAHWASPNAGATNISGFTALPGGHRNADMLFYNIHAQGFFWTTHGADNLYVCFGLTYQNDGSIFFGSVGNSVIGNTTRCVKN